MENLDVFKELITATISPFNAQIIKAVFNYDIKYDLYQCKLYLSDARFFIIEMHHRSFRDYRDTNDSKSKMDFLGESQKNIKRYLENEQFHTPLRITFGTIN
ncbi:hypothetical protein J2N86_15050 (plasmid) [Legionella lytica]|uniref:Uncharacterized protein n=1 Tax=Legionella lytica TaxID=96232 RepID=A0ABY4YDP6_9GAMM|nr:hypothetical protein [Legionella lytica]USQ15277.1 hypothetical protein J2N86_15050 [Legionella lytica]